MSLFPLTTSDIHPDSAEARAEKARGRIIGLEAIEALSETKGVKPDFGSPDYHYIRLVRAQLAFAEAQIAAKKAAQCRAEEPAKPKSDAHHDLLIEELRRADPANPILRFVEEAFRG